MAEVSLSRRNLLGGVAAGGAATALPAPAPTEDSRLDNRMRSDEAWGRSGPAFGQTEAIRTTKYHTRTGARDVQAASFHQMVEVDRDRELRSLTIPTLTAPRPHLFAISLEKPT